MPRYARQDKKSALAKPKWRGIVEAFGGTSIVIKRDDHPLALTNL